MRIVITAQKPQELWDNISDAIAGHKRDTWVRDTDGNFVHQTPSGQWAGAGTGAVHLLLVPHDTLIATFVPYNDVPVPHATSALIMGRFMQLLAVHHSDELTIFYYQP